MAGRERQRRTPAAVTPPPGDVEVRVEAPTVVKQLAEVPAAVGVEELRTEVTALREQVERMGEQLAEVTALLARRIERHRRRIEHPRIGPQPATD